MGAVAQVASGSWVLDAGTIWDPPGIPANGDLVTSSAAYSLIVDDNTNALGSFTRTGADASLTINTGKTLNVDGNCSLSSAVIGPGTISCSGTLTLDAGCTAAGDPILLLDAADAQDFTDNRTVKSGFVVQVNAAGSVTATVATANKSFDNAAGSTYVDGGLAHSFAGDILDAGTITSTAGGIWTQTAPGSLKGGTYAEFHNLAGVVTTLTSAALARKVNFDGRLVGGALTFYIYQPSGPGWWTQGAASSIESKVWVVNAYSHAPGGDIILQNKMLHWTSSGNSSVVIDGDINLNGGQFQLNATGSGNLAQLDLNGHSLSCGALTLGRDDGGSNASGLLKCGEGVVSIGSLVDGNANNTQNELVLEKCYMEVAGGVMDGTNITVSADDDNLVHIVCTGAGEIKEINVPDIVHCHGDSSVDGGNNGNATFNTHAPPGTLALMGAGV